MPHFVNGSAAIILSVLAAPAFGQSVTEQSVNSARAICILMDNSELLTQPCEYSIWSGSISAVADFSVAEAKEVCDLIVTGVRENDIPFEDGWTLNIQSPFSGDKNIATCDLSNPAALTIPPK